MHMLTTLARFKYVMGASVIQWSSVVNGVPAVGAAETHIMTHEYGRTHAGSSQVALATCMSSCRPC
jgi:hypothetical protein